MQLESPTALSSHLDVSAADVDAAAERIKGTALLTPLHLSARLSAQSGANVWLKREDMQPVRSYKIRGAQNFLAQLNERHRAAGVICASAGNHGQGVALACASLGVKALIYIPSTTPRQKRDRMNALGNGHVQLVVTGETYDDSYQAALEEVGRSGMTMVPAFDDARTISVQGTVAREIVDQLGGAPDVVLVPVGGGGMVAGMLAWFAEHAPHTLVIGVEPVGAPCMKEALAAGHPVRL